jgi:hypothetical protein
MKGGKTEQMQLKIWPEIIPKKTLTKWTTFVENDGQRMASQKMA